jgi:pyruvate/2-oxoglutarate/acetoin dehydrogenase E1 component
VIVQEAWNFCGFAAEVAAVLADEGAGTLEGPVKRVGARHVPIPFSPPLERYVLPEIEDVIGAVEAALGLAAPADAARQ